MDGHSRLHPAPPSGLGEINISLPSSRQPAFSLNQVRSYLPKGWEGLSYKRRECCDLPSRDKRPRALQDGGGKGKEGPSPRPLVSSAGSVPDSGLCSLLTCPAASSTGSATGMLAAPTGTNRGSIAGRPSREVPVATAFKTLGKLAQAFCAGDGRQQLVYSFSLTPAQEVLSRTQRLLLIVRHQSHCLISRRRLQYLILLLVLQDGLQERPALVA